MQLGPSRTTWRRYVALGDSFAEGLADADPQCATCCRAADPAASEGLL